MSNFADGSREGILNKKNEKLGQKGAWPRSRGLLLNFGTPLIISGSDEATNVKFCRRIEGEEY